MIRNPDIFSQVIFFIVLRVTCLPALVSPPPFFKGGRWRFLVPDFCLGCYQVFGEVSSVSLFALVKLIKTLCTLKQEGNKRDCLFSHAVGLVAQATPFVG